MTSSTPSEPIFNVPLVVTLMLAVLVIIHAGRALFLSEHADVEFLVLFAFIPARYNAAVASVVIPDSAGAEAWSFVTYSLIHGDSMHLAVNAVWLLAFGTAVARRFGPRRFLAFWIVTAAAGAVAHLLTHSGEPYPMIGASAVVSGCMAAALRFVFQSRTAFAGPAGSGQHAALPLRALVFDRQVMTFVIAWLVFNALFALMPASFTGGQSIAWQAHLGGFLAGLLLFRWFDPNRSQA